MWLLLFVFFDKTAADWCGFAPFRIGVVCETIVSTSWGGGTAHPASDREAQTCISSRGNDDNFHAMANETGATPKRAADAAAEGLRLRVNETDRAESRRVFAT